MLFLIGLFLSVQATVVTDLAGVEKTAKGQGWRSTFLLPVCLLLLPFTGQNFDTIFVKLWIISNSCHPILGGHNSYGGENHTAWWLHCIHPWGMVAVTHLSGSYVIICHGEVCPMGCIKLTSVHKIPQPTMIHLTFHAGSIWHLIMYSIA